MLPAVTSLLPSVTIGCQVTTDSCPMWPAGTNLTSGNYLWIGAKQVVPRCDQAVSRCDQLFVRCQYMLPEVSFIIGDGTKCDQVWPDVTRSDLLWPGTDFTLYKSQNTFWSIFCAWGLGYGSKGLKTTASTRSFSTCLRISHILRYKIARRQNVPKLCTLLEMAPLKQAHWASTST